MPQLFGMHENYQTVKTMDNETCLNINECCL